MTAEESSDEKMPPNEAEIAASTAASKMDPETEPLNAGGDAKVKFIGGSDTVDVEKGGQAKASDEIKGALTKAELMKYATDKKWVTLRWALFILFWICWLAMLVASVVIIIQAPKCPSPEPKQWWQKAPIYEVYVKSFKDSDGDGVGDLNGVSSQVDYLKGLGVGSVHLSLTYSPDDHKKIDSTFGTIEDFKNLAAKLHDNGMKVIMNFIPNYKPTLDLSSDLALNELTDILQFWMNEGVDGFRVDSADQILANESEVIALLKKFRAVLDEASKDNPSDPRILITQATNFSPYYGNISHIPLNFNLLQDFTTPSSVNADALKASLEKYMNALPEDAWPNYSLGNDETSRVATRLGPEKATAMNMILMLLKGTPFTYYGEEIGMVDGASVSRYLDSYRTPMLWSAETNAGFTSATPWVPVNSDSQNVNVAKAEDTEDSILKIYREMTNLRENEAILFGDTNLKVQDNAFVLSRVKKGNPGYLFVSNFGENESVLDLSQMPNIAERGILSISAPKSELGIGSSIDLANVSVPPKVSFLITFVPKF